MSGLFDQITNYSPPLLTAGQVNYKGTWDASANSPALTSPPAATTKGDYYVVSVAGTQFSISFAVGDWIISNGTAWEKVDLTDAVSSVFGRTGAVVGVSTDYSAVGLTNTAIGAANPSSGAFTSLSSSSTTTLNGTTVPASKTLVVTTDKLSALASTTSSELAGVISDETGSGALVFGTSPTIATPVIAQINDANGNSTLRLTGITSATDYLEIKNGIGVGSPLHVLAEGASTNIGVHLQPKGSGLFTISDGTDFNKGIRFRSSSSAASAVTLIDAVSTAGRVVTLPDATGTLLYGGGPLGTPASGTVTNLTGTASININGTVGATTASTGAFTTLSASGNTTIGAGGTAFFTVTNTTGTGGTTINAMGGPTTGNFKSADSVDTASSRWTFGRDNQSTGDFVWYENGSARMKIATGGGLAVTGALSSTTGANFATSSGSVGIGISSPISGATLDVRGANQNDLTDLGAQLLTLFDTTSYAQNVGAGIALGYKFNSSGSYIQRGAIIKVIKENATDGNYASSLIFATTANAVAGAERMRITSTGNVGIGTSAPDDLLHVFKGDSGLTTPHSYSALNVENSTHVAIQMMTPNNSESNIWFGDPESATVGGVKYYHVGNVMNLRAGEADRITIDGATGNVGIGTASPAAALHVLSGTDADDGNIKIESSGNTAGATFYSPSHASASSRNWGFFNNYNAAGYFELLVSTSKTNAPTVTLFRADTTGLAVTGIGTFGSGGSLTRAAINGGFSSAYDGLSLLSSDNASNAVFAGFFNSSGTFIGSIARVTTTGAVVYNTTSDARLKENLRDFTDSGRLIDALKPRVFDWKNSDENGKNVVGFIAQEEHAADPIFAHIGAVSVGDEDAETITKQWQRSDSALIPILVAELKSLRQRVAALENSN